MNEEKIAAGLAAHLKAQNINQDDPGLISEPQYEETPIEAYSNNLPLDNMVLRQTTMDFLGVSPGARNSTETIDQVNAIIRWAAELAPSKEMTDILETIHQQIRMKGWQIKEDKVQRMYRYVKLNSQRNFIEAQMRGI